MAKYGNVLHIIADSRSKVAPKVGMGVTVLMWTDRHAGTITEVSKSGKSFTFQQDDATRTDSLGRTDSGQKYAYTPNPVATPQKALLSKNGWKVVGAGKILLDVRDEYYDHGF